MSTLNPTAGAHDFADHAHGEHHEIGFIRKYVFSTDHKIIGIQFLITTLLMLMVGGALALAVRWQLAFPWQSMPIFGAPFATEGGQISPEFYTMLFTMHATVMIFLVIIPVLAGAFGTNSSSSKQLTALGETSAFAATNLAAVAAGVAYFIPRLGRSPRRMGRGSTVRCMHCLSMATRCTSAANSQFQVRR